MTTTIDQDEINDIVWKACDSFRGVMSSDQYKDYILTFLFLKFLSDLVKERREELDPSVSRQARDGAAPS